MFENRDKKTQKNQKEKTKQDFLSNFQVNRRQKKKKRTASQKEKEKEKERQFFIDWARAKRDALLLVLHSQLRTNQRISWLVKGLIELTAHD